ncbi:MAG: cysteine desulfurase [Urechidicola sp.]|jgi:cysteine desulfurase
MQLSDLLESSLASIPGVVIFSAKAKLLANTTYFSIPYYHVEALLLELDCAGFSLASGSACHSEVTKASHVLTAMSIEDSLALNAVRVSFGSTNTRQDVESLVVKLRELVNNLPAVIRQAAV